MWRAALGFHLLWVLQDLVWAQENRTTITPQNCSLDCIQKVSRLCACVRGFVFPSGFPDQWLELFCSFEFPSRNIGFYLGFLWFVPPKATFHLPLQLHGRYLLSTHLHTSSLADHLFGRQGLRAVWRYSIKVLTNKQQHKTTVFPIIQVTFAHFKE